MRVKWYGTATLLVESGGTRVLIDPYLKSRAKRLPPVPLEEARSAQAILITHPHLDHFRDIDTFSEGVRTVFVPARGIAGATEKGLDVVCMRPIAAGDSRDIGSLHIRAYPARHCKFDARTVLRVVFSLRAWLHFFSTVRFLKEVKRYEISDDDILAYEISDGRKRLFVLGSAGLAAGYPYPKDADMLVFPFQGRYGMHRYMRKFLDAFAPQAVFADHFDDAFPPLTHKVKTAKFVREAEARGVEAVVPREGEWYEV